VQKAINRFHIQHPVANDPDLHIWNMYTVKSWPTLVFIDAEGYVVGMLRGEGHRKALDNLIANHIDIADRKGLEATTTVTKALAPEKRGVMLFPGRILATPSRLFISDSGHNRIIETDHNGRVVRVFGSRSAGFIDADGRNAAFSNPQGLLLAGDFLYVADTDNHAIRRVNLLSDEVITIAGNGKQGMLLEGVYSEPLKVSLNSPWALEMVGGDLFIAMAGQHQLWNLDLSTNEISVHTGSGEENLVDGKGPMVRMAQPSGLAIDPDFLYVVDAESSSVRRLNRFTNHVDTLVGKGLFEFGDRDGPFNQVQLQHPLDICDGGEPDIFYLADTYNNKIKKVDTKSHAISSLDVGQELDEPGGICRQGNNLWIANTNAHEIISYDLVSGISKVVELNEPERYF
jgi:hypothetical protein